MSSDVIRLAPDQLRYKLDDVADLQAPVWPGEWDRERLMPLDRADKHRSIAQRYREGRKWEDTDLFRNAYRERIERGEMVRGCSTIAELAAQYYDRVDGMYQHLRRHGFLTRLPDGMPVKLPGAYLGRDGMILSNDGNHRVAMAQVLGLPHVYVRVRTRHPDARWPPACEPFTVEPALHPGAAEIPAMTTPAEQFAGYTLAKQAGGTVVELGAWLGAMTVYLAAGVRDSGGPHQLHVFDRFVWDSATHEPKAGGPLDHPMLEQFRLNLGPLWRHTQIHQGEIATAKWDGGPISLLVADGPKRVAEITRTLEVFGTALTPGSHMAWQDFAYFPAYDLPACLDRLEQTGAISFVRGIYPGTTVIFRVERRITPEDIAQACRPLARWSPDAIEQTWARWIARLPEGGRPRFACGAALFLCDRGAPGRATALFRDLLKEHRAEIAPKWEVLRQRRSWALKYPTLFEALDA